MAEIVSVTPDCFIGGYVITVDVPAAEPNLVSVARRNGTTGGFTPVRGLQHIPENSFLQIVDYEVPFEHDISYVLFAEDGNQTELDSDEPTENFRTACGLDGMYLRWLFQPEVMVRNFCLGVILEQTHQPRVGVFPVIGRGDPVVVSDEQETARGTLRFVGVNTSEVNSLRNIFTRSAQPTLLSLPVDYMLGQNGLLYFQPLAVRDEWLNPDARIPHHSLVIDYVEISPPGLTSSLSRTGVPFGAAKGSTVGSVTYPNGGWIIWDTDPPDGTYHGDPTDRWTSFNALVLSGKTFSEALYDKR